MPAKPAIDLTPFRASVETVGSVQFNEGLAQPLMKSRDISRPGKAVQMMPSVYFQIIDAYGFQRELSIRWNSDAQKYEVHAYIHPGMRNKIEVDERDGLLVINHFRHFAAQYPDRIFGNNQNGARAAGFYAMHTFLMHGCNVLNVIKGM